MKPYLWQAKELQKRFSDVWQLKNLLCKTEKNGKSAPRQTQRDPSVAMLPLRTHILFSWAGCKYSPHPIGYSIVKERDESGPAASLTKALREWRIADVLSTGPEDKWRTG